MSSKNYETIVSEENVNGLLKTNVWEILQLALVQCKKGIYVCFRLVLNDKFCQLNFCKAILIKALFSYLKLNKHILSWIVYRMKAEQNTSYKYVRIIYSDNLFLQPFWKWNSELGNVKSVQMCVIVHIIMLHYFLSAIPPSH